QICRKAVTELIIGANTLPYVVSADEISTTYCMLIVPNSYSVTACRKNTSFGSSTTNCQSWT
ncbi:hypothetical protein KKG56_01385, partial [bacterium]|nr:hypothetical protein [bacterium]